MRSFFQCLERMCFSQSKYRSNNVNLFLIALGASLGALCRHSLNVFAQQYLSLLGTFLANVIGCLLIGIVYSHSSQLSQEIRLCLITGFLGSLTTMSSFSLDVHIMIQQEQWVLACGLVLLTLIGCVCSTFLGAYLGARFP